MGPLSLKVGLCILCQIHQKILAWVRPPPTPPFLIRIEMCLFNKSVLTSSSIHSLLFILYWKSRGLLARDPLGLLTLSFESSDRVTPDMHLLSFESLFKTLLPTIRLAASRACSTLLVEALSTGPLEKLGFHTGIPLLCLCNTQCVCLCLT